jgi:2-oxoglutarate ferredoxin oxidoreductase subunit beta
MKVAVKMLNWLKEKGVPKETYDRLTDPQKDGYFVIGKLVDRDAPDFNTRYEEIRARAMGS